MITRKIENELEALKKDRSNLVKQITRATDDTLRDIYEDELRTVEERRQSLQSDLEVLEGIDTSFEYALGTVIKFMSNPKKIWDQGNVEHKKLVLTLVFAQPVKFSKIKGFGTASMTLPFRVLDNTDTLKSRMVEGAGYAFTA